jgi:hypothetical protein
MNEEKQNLKDKLRGIIGNIGWKLFVWSYPGGQSQYLDDIYHEEKMIRSQFAEQDLTKKP